MCGRDCDSLQVQAHKCSVVIFSPEPSCTHSCAALEGCMRCNLHLVQPLSWGFVLRSAGEARMVEFKMWGCYAALQSACIPEHAFMPHFTALRWHIKASQLFASCDNINVKRSQAKAFLGKHSFHPGGCPAASFSSAMLLKGLGWTLHVGIAAPATCLEAIMIHSPADEDM